MRRSSIGDAERDLLALTDLDVDTSAVSLAKVTRSKIGTVRDRLQRLKREGQIERHPVINPYICGLIECTLLFSLKSGGAKQRLRVSTELVGMRRTAWVGELGAEFHYGVSIMCGHISEFREFLGELNRISHQSLQKRLFAVRTSSRLFPRKYLFDRPLRNSLHLRGGIRVADLDDLDRRIIIALLDASYESLRDLTQFLKIPLATLDRRLGRLRERKIFLGWRNGASSTLLGAQKFSALISLKDQSLALLDQISEWASAQRNVVHIIEAIGDWDLELGIEVFQADEIPKILDAWYATFAAFSADIRIIPEFSCLKFRAWPGNH